MKIKKYIANSMPEAMNLIKKELGQDAVILSSKEIKKGGVFGLFQKKSIEVIAALDHAESKPVKQVNKPQITSQDRNGKVLNHQNQEVLAEIKHLQSLLATQQVQSINHFPLLFEHVYQFLLTQEVEAELAKMVVNQMIARTKGEQITMDLIKDYLRDALNEQLNIVDFSTLDDGKKIIQFVGPTGVGKTTTIAKVAAKMILEEKKKVAFITTDTYRIAAIEQLKTYATILGVPVEVAYTLEDYELAIKKFVEYDMIFVDTAGRNFRDDRYINDIKTYINHDTDQVQTFLVLALTAKYEDVKAIYTQFKPLKINQLIFTKMDETLTYGALLNILVEKDVGLAYLTNGQNVPDDLINPTKSYIAELIVSRYQHD